MSDLVRSVAACVKRERRRAGWSMGELARRSGVSKSTLSQLESGVGNPSVETVWALATALDVPFSRLVEPEASDVTVIRAGGGAAFATEAGGYVATLLSTAPPGSRRDIYRIEAAPGGRRESDAHPGGTVEHVLLCAGDALVGPGDEPVRLREGDFITYRGDAPHVFEAGGRGASAVLVSEQS